MREITSLIACFASWQLNCLAHDFIVDERSCVDRTSTGIERETASRNEKRREHSGDARADGVQCTELERLDSKQVHLKTVFICRTLKVLWLNGISAIAMSLSLASNGIFNARERSLMDGKTSSIFTQSQPLFTHRPSTVLVLFAPTCPTHKSKSRIRNFFWEIVDRWNWRTAAQIFTSPTLFSSFNFECFRSRLYCTQIERECASAGRSLDHNVQIVMFSWLRPSHERTKTRKKNIRRTKIRRWQKVATRKGSVFVVVTVMQPWKFRVTYFENRRREKQRQKRNRVDIPGEQWQRTRQSMKV